MESKELKKYELGLNVVESYEKITREQMTYAKIHIKKEIENRALRIRDYALLLGLEPETLRSFLNHANTSPIPMKLLIKLCICLQIEFKEIIEPIKHESKRESAREKKWTDKNIKAFISDVETLSTEEVSKKWKLKEGSIRTTYIKFNRKAA